MSTEKTRVDRWIVSAKNHKFLSIVIFGVIILIGIVTTLAGIASVPESISKILKPFSEEKPITKPQSSDNSLPVHRLYHPEKESFLYTTSVYERREAEKQGWLYQGIGWQAPQPSDSTIPVHRLYNPKKGSFMYTTSVNEVDEAKKFGWFYEGIGFQAQK